MRKGGMGRGKVGWWVTWREWKREGESVGKIGGGGKTTIRNGSVSS